MTRPTLEQLRAIGNFATTFRWKIEFSPNPIVFAGLTPEDLNLRCETSTLPKATTTSLQVDIRGQRKKQAAITNYDNVLTLGFVETEDNKISRMISNWRKAVWDPNTGKAKKQKEVEVTVTLIRLDSQDNEIWQYNLVGCYYEDADMGTLDGAGTEALKPQLTLSYDYFDDGPA